MNSGQTLAVLNELLDYARNAPFYRERLPQKPLFSLEEFKAIPLLTKQDLQRNSPFGLVCPSREELYQYYESLETNGKTASVWLTAEDFLTNAEQLMLWGVQFRTDDVVMVRFSYSQAAMADAITTAAQLRGACVIPAGAHSTVSPLSQAGDLLRKLEVTVLACAPLEALLIAEAIEESGFNPQRDFPCLRAICTAGELLAPGRRKTLENIWGVTIFDCYGRTEFGTAAVDCEFKRSHPLDDHFYLEILREDLTAPVQTGETGLMVVTTLQRLGTPLIRYLTGDRARLRHEDCICGNKVSLEIQGPVAEMLYLS